MVGSLRYVGPTSMLMKVLSRPRQGKTRRCDHRTRFGFLEDVSRKLKQVQLALRYKYLEYFQIMRKVVFLAPHTS